MSILNRYILKELFYFFAIILGMFTVILVVKEVNDLKDEILNYSPPTWVVLQYIALNLPGTLAEGLPLMALFSVLFTIGLMSKNREIIAMVAAGVSFRSLAVPALIFGSALTAGLLGLYQYVVPWAKQRANFLYKVGIRGDNPDVVLSNNNIFRKGAGQRFYIISNFNGATNVMNRPSVIEMDPTGSAVSRRIEARRARLVVSPDRKDRHWEFEDAELWTFGEGGAVTLERFSKENPLHEKMEDKIENFLGREKSPDEMSITDLGDYCDILASQGAATQLPKFKAHYHAKISLTFSCLLLCMIAFSIGADVQLRRFVMVFTTGLVFGIAYYVLHETMKSMGSSGFMTQIAGTAGPAIGAWSPVAIYAVIAAWFFRRLSTVH